MRTKSFFVGHFLCLSVLIYLLLGLSSLMLFFGCASNARGPVAKVYHNTTAKYNAYFLAREKMKELEKGLYLGIKNNYNRPLDLYPKVDKSTAEGMKSQLDDIIKKSSMPIQWHKYSKWVDDAYILIGKCRYYDLDLENATITFKYVNSKSEDDAARHEALILLLRTFTDNQEYGLAKEVYDFLSKEDFNKKNQGEFAIAAAHYHLKAHQDIRGAYDDLRTGAYFVKPKDRKSRAYYVIGQLAQKLDLDPYALIAYKRVVKLNPAYEMWFNAKLNIAQLTELKSEDDAEKVLRFYRKLLKDPKNDEYKDKIYYEMGRFESKRENFDEALSYYKLSAKNGGATPYVKSYAYLRMADIYYDQKQAFENASLYYDSTIMVLEKDVPEYPRAFKRQRILQEFVRQLRIVRKQDSLIQMASMDTTTLYKYIDGQIALKQKQEADQAKLEAKLAKQAERDKDTTGSAFINSQAPKGNTTGSNNKWYFYNPVSIENGRAEFARKWGNRPLEDGWRRSIKDKISEDEFQAINLPKSKVLLNDSAKKSLDSLQKTQPKVAAGSPREAYLKDIPFDQVGKDTAHARLSRALFKLGQIYDQNLEEYKNAAATFDRLYKEYPQHERTPEGLYAEYLIYKNKLKNPELAKKYADILLNEYPESLYAKLIVNPDYLKIYYAMNQKLRDAYRDVYELYEKGYYLQAQTTVQQLISEYPKNEIEDKIALLNTMIIGQTQDPVTYKKSIQDFLEKFPKTPLKPFAEALLGKVNEMMAKMVEGNSRTKFVKYDIDLDQPHFFIVAIPKNLLDAQIVIDKFKKYNDNFFTVEKLSTQKQILNDSVQLVVIRQFVNNIQGKNYVEKQKGVSSPLYMYKERNFKYFIITQSNFQILLESQNLESYMAFYGKNYQ